MLVFGISKRVGLSVVVVCRLGAGLYVGDMELLAVGVVTVVLELDDGAAVGAAVDVI